ncbi:MAG: bifunctional serine/threonine-protein kinase/formylglycine-generating enzyme family protein [Gemmatimonadota bacterium]|nr:bifunctional serine/threonine-protein kinase/formylglycine-generating enzyme family protein [Gemmatimonadota bacterium]
MNESQHPLNALPQGYRLQEYELVEVLGTGGFGITYLGFDHNLDKNVAVKEFLPDDIATRTQDNSVGPKASYYRDNFKWGLERFLDEARTLARFDHRNIVKVHRFFEAHGTAYIVMEYAEGMTLAEFLQQEQTLKEAELKEILYPILSGLAVVHGADFLHRDIKPGNIVLREEDRSPVLLDFGAARQAIGAKSRSVTSIITPGYAPIEQYSKRGHQGPWTDIYALGAVCYHALSGQIPYDATDRVRVDPLVPAVDQCRNQATHEFLSAIDWALQVDERERPQSVGAWRAALEGEQAEPPPDPRPVAPGIPGVEIPLSRLKRIGSRLAGALAILALLIAGVYYIHEYVHPSDQQPVVPEVQSEIESETETVDQEEEARQRDERISGLLSGAREDLASDRLTSPAGANAWEKYLAVLELSPEHPAATAGLESVLGRYERIFDAALARKQFSRAQRLVSRIRQVRPDAPVLARLEDRLSSERSTERRRRREEQAAERVRQARIGAYKVRFAAALSAGDFAAAGKYVDSLRAVGADASVLSEAEGRLSASREEAGPGGRLAVGRVFRDCVRCPEMVIVPSGSFRMGSPGSEEDRNDNEGPRHDVRIDYRFAVGLYEVTFAEWDACANAGGCGGYIPEDEGWGRGNRPVVNVSWRDAQKYTKWLSEETGHAYRLLSESEWEYAARAGTTTARYWGESSEEQCEYANGADEEAQQYNSSWAVASCDDKSYRTSPVGSYASNEFGLHDVLGNVWEWVADCWNGSYSGAPVDGRARETGDCSKRVLRGGSWFNGPGFLRSALRYRNSAGYRSNLSGIRVARTLRH